MISTIFNSLLILAGFANVDAPIQITNNPSVVAKTCESYTLTWSGGLAPYTVQIHYRAHVGQGASEPLEVNTIIKNVMTQSYTTKLNVPHNAESDSGALGFVRFGVWDAEFNVFSFPLIDQKIAAGPDASCLPMMTTANDTRPQSPFQEVALAGPGKTVPQCSTLTFMILGELQGEKPASTISLKTIGLTNDMTIELFNIISTNVSMELPFPAGTSFTSAAGSGGEVAGDIERVVSAGTSNCLTA